VYHTNLKDALAHLRGEDLTDDLTGVVLEQTGTDTCRVRFHVCGREIEVVKLVSELVRLQTGHESR
jgi:hypothetical protein